MGRREGFHTIEVVIAMGLVWEICKITSIEAVIGI
jgi:hypothetical protein